MVSRLERLNKVRCKTSFATWFLCIKELVEFEAILYGVSLPQGHVYFNVAALRPCSKAQQIYKPGK